MAGRKRRHGLFQEFHVVLPTYVRGKVQSVEPLASRGHHGGVRVAYRQEVGPEARDEDLEEDVRALGRYDGVDGPHDGVVEVPEGAQAKAEEEGGDNCRADGGEDGAQGADDPASVGVAEVGIVGWVRGDGEAAVADEGEEVDLGG